MKLGQKYVWIYVYTIGMYTYVATSRFTIVKQTYNDITFNKSKLNMMREENVGFTSLCDFDVLCLCFSLPPNQLRTL